MSYGLMWIDTNVAIEKDVKRNPKEEKMYFFKFNLVSSVLSENKYLIGIQKLGINISQAVTPNSQKPRNDKYAPISPILFVKLTLDEISKLFWSKGL